MANATINDAEYREGGVIAVPLIFAETVIIPSKTVFAVTHVSGDALTGIRYVLLGEGTAYELVFTVPPDRRGSFKISAAGDVLLATGIYENVVATAKTVAYDTSVPRLKNYDIPEDYTPGEIFDVILQFDIKCTLNNPQEHFGDEDARYTDFFIFEGAVLNTDPPNFYRKTDDTYPSELPLLKDLGTDWTQEGLEKEEATIYLLRWNEVQPDAEGIFNLTMKPGFVRGPVI